MTANASKERQDECGNWASQYATNSAAITGTTGDAIQQKVTLAQIQLTLLDEKAVLAGNRPLSAGAKPGFPQPK